MSTSKSDCDKPLGAVFSPQRRRGPLDAGYRWEGAAEQVRQIKARGLLAVGYMHCTIFATAWYLRGMEEFLADLLAEPEIARALMDRLAALRRAQARNYARAGADIIQFGDDVSTQLAILRGAAPDTPLPSDRAATGAGTMRRAQARNDSCTDRERMGYGQSFRSVDDA